MNKEARKQSSDPIQEKLRAQKEYWNKKKVTPFIDNLIHFKKLMNGSPSKFNGAKSQIGEPVPVDPATIIAILSSDFNEIAAMAASITDAQLQYSKSRRRKKQVQTVDPNQLNLPFGKNSSLQLEASNKVTRFFSHLNVPYFGYSSEARERKFRLTLLTAASNIEKEVKKLEHEILRDSPASILTSRLLINKINDQIYIAMSQLTFFSESKAEKEEKAKFTQSGPVKGVYPFTPLAVFPGVVSPPKGEPLADNGPSANPASNRPASAGNIAADVLDEEEEFGGISVNNMPIGIADNDVHSQPGSARSVTPLTDPLEIQNDVEKYHGNIPNLFNDPLLKEVQLAITMVVGTQNPITKAQKVVELVRDYANLITYVNSQLGTHGDSLRDILLSLNRASERYSERLETLADNMLSKWINKTKHRLSPTNRTSALRLEIFESASRVKDLIDDMMNSLEKSLNVSELEVFFKTLVEEITLMDKVMKPLELFTKGVNLDNEFMKSLEQGNGLQNGIQLSDKDKENFQKMVRNKELRQMVNMKGKK